MKKTVQILLFIISYSPLYLILFFQNLNDNFYLKGTKKIIGFIELAPALPHESFVWFYN